MIKKGTFVVRTASNDHLAKQFPHKGVVGAIFPVIRDNEYGNAAYAEGYSMSRTSFRLATKEEIQAYHKGSRNVNDIICKEGYYFQEGDTFLNSNGNRTTIVKREGDSLKLISELGTTYTTNVSKVREYFNKGTYTHYKSVVVYRALKNFSVYIKRNIINFEKYIKLCKEYKIPYNDDWVGDSPWYGCNRGVSLSMQTNFGDTIFITIEEFEEFLISNFNKAKKDEVSRKNFKESRGQVRGNFQVSKQTKQTATGSRPIGNSARVNVKKTRFRSAIISRNVVKC